MGSIYRGIAPTPPDREKDLNEEHTEKMAKVFYLVFSYFAS